MDWLCPCLKKDRNINNDDEDEGDYDHRDGGGKFELSVKSKNNNEQQQQQIVLSSTTSITDELNIQQVHEQLCGYTTGATSTYNSNVSLRDGCFGLPSIHYHSSVIRDETNGFVINPSSSQQPNDYEKDNEDGNKDEDDSNDATNEFVVNPNDYKKKNYEDNEMTHTKDNDSTVVLSNLREKHDDIILNMRSSSFSCIDNDDDHDVEVGDGNESGTTTTVDRSIKATVGEKPYNTDSSRSSEASTVNIYERQEKAPVYTKDSVLQEQRNVTVERSETKNQQDQLPVERSFTPINKKSQLLLSPGTKMNDVENSLFMKKVPGKKTQPHRSPTPRRHQRQGTKMNNVNNCPPKKKVPRSMTQSLETTIKVLDKDSVHKEQRDIAPERRETKNNNQRDHPRAVAKSFTLTNKKCLTKKIASRTMTQSQQRQSPTMTQSQLRKYELDVAKRCLARLAANARPIPTLPTVAEQKQSSRSVGNNNPLKNNIKNTTPASSDQGTKTTCDLTPTSNALFTFSEDSEEYTKVSIDSRHNEYLRSTLSDSAAAYRNRFITNDDDNDSEEISEVVDSDMNMMTTGQHAGRQQLSWCEESSEMMMRERPHAGAWQLPWLPHEMHDDDDDRGDSLLYAAGSSSSSSWQGHRQQQHLVMSQFETSDDCYNSTINSCGSDTITPGGSYETMTTSLPTTRESKKFLETLSFLENWLDREDQRGEEEVVMRRGSCDAYDYSDEWNSIESDYCMASEASDLERRLRERYSLK